MAILLKKLLRETVENRFNLLKIGALLEKVLPELTSEEAGKVTGLFTELSVMATEMNEMPYTKFNAQLWQHLIEASHTKSRELRDVIVKIGEEKTVEVFPLVKAIDEVFSY